MAREAMAQPPANVKSCVHRGPWAAKGIGDAYQNYSERVCMGCGCDFGSPVVADRVADFSRDARNREESQVRRICGSPEGPPGRPADSAGLSYPERQRPLRHEY